MVSLLAPVLLLLAASPWDEPMERAWPAERAWSVAEEAGYERFVERLGAAVASGRCARLDDCLRDPAANDLFDARFDRPLTLFVDCADLPYTLRAYYAFRRRLPFGFVSRVAGGGGEGEPPLEDRFLRGATPAEWRSWREFETPGALLRELPDLVHSGMLRLAAPVENGDFYPVRVRRGTIRPGAVFYDPGGHVLVVSAVERDGTVRFVDGHPDGTLTSTRLPALATPGPFELGGGFKRFRPLRLDGETLVRTPNSALADYDARRQWSSTTWSTGDGRRSFAAWVRRTLARPGVEPDRLVDFRGLLDEVCRDIDDRSAAVERAVAAGLPRRPHPPALPANVFGGRGEWESYSTPSKDARLKLALRELRQLAAVSRRLRRRMKQAWLAAGAQPACRARYRDSAGSTVELTLDDVVDRLFALSFDPYDCPERRWGAPPGSAEAAACLESPEAERWYGDEQRLRFRLDRGFGEPTPLDDGPARAPLVDPRPLLGIRPAPAPAGRGAHR